MEYQYLLSTFKNQFKGKVIRLLVAVSFVWYEVFKSLMPNDNHFDSILNIKKGLN